jgi:deoxyribose-phosphate aldolase
MDLAAYFDHTLLKPEATSDSLRKLCSEAVEWGFFSVCVNPCWVPFCVSLLSGERPIVCSVAGFPLGASPLAPEEAAWAVSRGAREIDAVIPVGLLKEGSLLEVRRALSDITASVPGIPVKFIIETGLLTDGEKVTACELSLEAGAAFVKTCTGFAGSATARDVELMRNTVGDRAGVKASGGIRDYSSAMEMIAAGADRIGTSSGTAIMEAFRSGVT